MEDVGLVGIVGIHTCFAGPGTGAIVGNLLEMLDVLEYTGFWRHFVVEDVGIVGIVGIPRVWHT